MTAATALAIVVVRLLVYQFVRPFTLRFLVPTQNENGTEKTEQQRNKIALKIEDHLIDGLVLGTSAACAIYIGIDQDWWPAEAGGHGHLSNFFT